MAANRMLLVGAALVAEEDQVGAAADAELRQQIRDVEFHGALGDMQAVGDFLIREIFEQAAQDFLLAAAEFARGIGAEAASLGAAEDRIDEARKHRARHPKPPAATCGKARASCSRASA